MLKNFFVLIFILILPRLTFAEAKTVYLDIEDDETVSVFSRPGYDWKTCTEKNNCSAVGWPGNDAKIKVLTKTPKKIKIVDPETGKASVEEFHQVEFEYSREVDKKTYEKKGTGWMDASPIRYKKTQTFFGVKKKNIEKEKDDCPPENPAAKNNKDLADQADNFGKLSLTQTADLIAPAVGQCIALGKSGERTIASLNVKGNTYDQLVLPKIKNQSVPKVLAADGKAMTQAQLIEIDSIARTLYGEMGGCFKHGLHYPFAVTRVLVNRSESNREKEFIRGPHDPSKSNMSKVTTSASQLNVWMKRHEGKINPPLKQALCPPQDKDQNFYTGRHPSKFETDIWKNSVRIATQAVLFPKDFKARTSKVDVLFYTSGMQNFLGMKQVERSIEGRPVSLDKCVQLWKE